MPTLGDVHLAVFPTAARLAPPGQEPLLAPVAWVRVMKARTPAFDALEPGDLAIVPEAALDLLAAEVEEPAAMASIVRAAGVCGLLLVGPGDDADPSALGRAVAGEAAATGLPVLRLAGGDVERLERGIIGYLVNARAELDRQAGALELDLERLALAGAGPDAFAAAVATFVGRAVALEGVSGEVLAVHAPPRPATAARAAARYLADPRPVALRAPLAGTSALVLLGPEPVSELERTIAQRIGPLLALALGHVAPGAARSRSRRPEGFPAAGPPWVVLMARQGVPGEADGPEQREALRTRIRRLAGARHLQLRGDVDSLELRMVASPSPGDPLALRLAERVATVAGRLVAVSQAFAAPEARATAEADARATLDAASALPAFTERAGPRVARADRKAAYLMLSNLHNLPDGYTQAQRLLAPLLGARPSARARHLATMRAVLEQPGLATAATSLGVHRNTLAYRLRAIERLTGWQLDDPDLRLALLLALRLVQNDQ